MVAALLHAEVAEVVAREPVRLDHERAAEGRERTPAVLVHAAADRGGDVLPVAHEDGRPVGPALLPVEILAVGLQEPEAQRPACGQRRVYLRNPS